jgi:homoserine kinase
LHRVKVRIPATITSLGSGLHALGVAVSMHSHIALQTRSDSELSVSVSGDNVDDIPTSLDNLALRAAIRVFQNQEDAPAGLHVEVHNAIPFGYGLGEKIAQVVGGLIAAHNLIDSSLSRDEMMKIALSFDLPYEGIVAAMMGSVCACSLDPNEPHTLGYASFDLPPTRLIVIAPTFDNDPLQDIRYPKTVSLNDAVRMMRQSLLLAEGLQRGDFGMIANAFTYQISQEQFADKIPHLTTVQKVAKDAGAAAVMISGDGGLLTAFAEEEPHRVADKMALVYEKAGIEVRRWVLPIDRQGVVISELEPTEEELPEQS